MKKPKPCITLWWNTQNIWENLSNVENTHLRLEFFFQFPHALKDPSCIVFYSVVLLITNNGFHRWPFLQIHFDLEFLYHVSPLFELFKMLTKWERFENKVMLDYLLSITTNYIRLELQIEENKCVKCHFSPVLRQI